MVRKGPGGDAHGAGLRTGHEQTECLSGPLPPVWYWLCTGHPGCRHKFLAKGRAVAPHNRRSLIRPTKCVPCQLPARGCSRCWDAHTSVPQEPKSLHSRRLHATGRKQTTDNDCAGWQELLRAGEENEAGQGSQKARGVLFQGERTHDPGEDEQGPGREGLSLRVSQGACWRDTSRRCWLSRLALPLVQVGSHRGEGSPWSRCGGRKGKCWACQRSLRALLAPLPDKCR